MEPKSGLASRQAAGLALRRCAAKPTADLPITNQSDDPFPWEHIPEEHSRNWFYWDEAQAQARDRLPKFDNPLPLESDSTQYGEWVAAEVYDEGDVEPLPGGIEHRHGCSLLTAHANWPSIYVFGWQPRRWQR